MSATPDRADVVVVGGASAGYAAAVSARNAGAERVVVLEKAPESGIGGNCRYSVMGFRFVHEGTDDVISLLPEKERSKHGRARIASYTKDIFLSDLRRVTEGRMDEDLARVLVESSREAIDWMTSLGHQWELLYPVEANGHTLYNPGTALAPVGGGLELVGRWMAMGQQLGIELRLDSPVTAILGDYRNVSGVRVLGPEGSYEIEADSVILASGGFQASASRRAQYLPANADLMKVRGSRYNTGEVLHMAMALGAKTAGQWQGAHASPVDSHGPAMEMDDQVNRYGYPFGITVDTTGRRFFDEGEAHRTYTYAKTGWEVLKRPGGIAYQIFDQQTVGLVPGYYKTATPIIGESIEALADQLGIRANVLRETVDEYNASVDEQTPFDATREDGRGTQDLAVRKTNWANPLTQPPFVAYGVTGGITFTFGGLAINRRAEVLNTGGQPIKGLYANGDLLGLFYHNYPSCSGMTRNAVFGGLAGAAAAKAI